MGFDRESTIRDKLVASLGHMKPTRKTKLE